MSAKPVVRCAIYTRKSSEEGLDQAFNSLDAQHDACRSFIASQKHESWKLVADRYDDGGISGATLERPGLQRLLADIEAGRITLVVVYKIDRLTRSLADFVRIVERLGAKGCSFVSVTQAFNTSTSMGRLTLNVLLSFAQFEREVTAERIRDKISASKKKGLRMGGVVPLGYDRDPDPKVRGLVVNAAEAAEVRILFQAYDDLGCLRRVEAWANDHGLRSKRHVFATGRPRGGAVLTRGMIHHLLTNPIYIGRIRHGDKIYPGNHAALIPADFWERVQARLNEKAARARGRSPRLETASSPLLGKLRDETGDRLTPSHTRRRGRCFRTYVSSRLLSQGAASAGTGWRLPTPALEAALSRLIADHLQTAAAAQRLLRVPDLAAAVGIEAAAGLLVQELRCGPSALAALIAGVILRPDRIEISLDASFLAARLNAPPDGLDSEVLSFSAPFTILRRGVEARIVAGSLLATSDPNLRKVLVAAHRWLAALKAGQSLTAIAKTTGHSESYIRTRLPLALLSPRLQAALFDGTIGPDVTVEALVRADLPMDWAAHETRLGLDRA